MPIQESTIHSSLLGNERRVWLQPPPLNQPPQAICILLDGEYYVERMKVSAPIEEFQRSQVVPSFAVAYVSHVDGKTRWKESKCNETFARFVDEELTPWVKRQFGHSEEKVPVILGGLSLTGLAAAHAVLRCPDNFVEACLSLQVAISESPAAGNSIDLVWSCETKMILNSKRLESTTC